MKIKYLILLTIFSFNIYCQNNNTDKINIRIIVATTDAVLAEYLINEENSIYELKQYTYDYKFGENVIKDKAQRIDTLKYSENGFLKFNYLKSEFIRDENGGVKISNFEDYPVQIGLNGEILSKNDVRYKYNSNGKIIELKEYSKNGEYLEKHFEFLYNLKNQIIEVKQVYNSETRIRNKIAAYYYDKIGNIIKVLNYQKTDNKNFPKRIFYKLDYIYNSQNKLIEYHSYENNYGEHYIISNADLTKYVNGKRIYKTLAENSIDLNASYKCTQNLKYSYENENKNWTSRIEYEIMNLKKAELRLLNIVKQTKI